jgi:hypothetical protein
MAFRPAQSYHYERGHRLTTAATTAVVTAAQLQAFVKADSTMLPYTEADALVAQATNYIEQLSGLTFINQSWQLTLDAWPGYVEPWWDGVVQAPLSIMTSGQARWLDLPRYPLSSITSVTTYDEADAASVVVVDTVFQTDTQRMPGRLSLKSGQLWPTATRPTNAIVIVYVAGFGSAASVVPASLYRAVLQFASFLYEAKGGCDFADGFKKSGARSLISAYALRGV